MNKAVVRNKARFKVYSCLINFLNEKLCFLWDMIAALYIYIYEGYCLTAVKY